jgi:hypothetical protein
MHGCAIPGARLEFFSLSCACPAFFGGSLKFFSASLWSYLEFFAAPSIIGRSESFARSLTTATRRRAVLLPL